MVGVLEPPPGRPLLQPDPGDQADQIGLAQVLVVQRAGPAGRIVHVERDVLSGALHGLGDDRLEKAFLAAEIAVELRLVRPRGGDDPLDPGAGDAMLGELRIPHPHVQRHRPHRRHAHTGGYSREYVLRDKFAYHLGAEGTVLSRTPDKAADARALGAADLLVTTDDKQTDEARGRFDLILDTISGPHAQRARLPRRNPTANHGPDNGPEKTDLIRHRRTPRHSADAGVRRRTRHHRGCRGAAVEPG